jgi:PAS domain S-box-containing protein
VSDEMKLSTTRIVRASVAIVIITIATVLFISIRQSQRVRDTSSAVFSTQETLRHIQNLVLSVVDNETSSRGYVITADEDYLSLLDKSERQSRIEMAILAKMITDSAARRLLEDTLVPDVEKRTEFSRHVINVRNRQGIGAASLLVMSGKGKLYTAEVRRIASMLQQRENQLLEVRSAKNDRTISQLSTTLYVILSAVFVLSMLIIRKVRSDVYFIIQRRKREEELRKSEERFRLLVNNIKDYAIYMMDADGKVASWNSGAQRIKGYTAEEIIGQPIDVFYIAEEREAGEPANNLDTAKKQGHFEKEGWRLCKDGSVFWASIVISALFDEDGTLQGYAKITRDITERKKNEEQLQMLWRQLNEANDAIYVSNAGRVITSWNKGAEKLYEFTAEEAIGKDVNQLLQTHASPQEIEQVLDHLNVNDHWAGELKRKSKSGKEIYIYSSTTTIRDHDGKVDGYISVNIDITERKMMEEQLRKFNEELEEQVKQKASELTNIFERVTDAVIAMDNDFNCRYANKKAGELINRDPASIIGKSLIAEFPFFAETEAYKKALEAMSTQQPVIVEEDYEQMNFALESYIYPSEDGVSVFIRDITAQKKAERELKTAHERLLFHIENAPLGFVEWDSQLLVRSWSRRAGEIFGWDEQTALHHHGLEQCYYEDLPLLKDATRQLLEGEVERNAIQHRNYTKDGRIIWCEWFNSVIRDKENKVITILSLVQDITERKNTEEQIKKAFSEKEDLAERVSTILNTLPANIALLDEQGVIMEVNEAWKNFSPSNGLVNKDYGVGTDYLAIALSMHEPGNKDGKAVVRGILGVLSGRLKNYTFEYSHHSESGKKWFRLIVTPLCQKEKTGVVIMHIDITEQKISEDELRLSEQKYKLLFESNPMPMWMRSVDNMNIIDVNGAACIAYGYTKDEFLQLHHADLRHPDEVESFISEFQLDMPHPVNRGIWKHRKKDQTFIDVEIFAQDIVYNHQKVRLILAKDVTEKLKAEEQLKNSYQEIRRLASYLQNVREEERKNIAREIHDQLGQQLTVMKMDISWLEKKIVSSDKIAVDKMNELRNITDDTINLVRRIASDLRPGLLDDMGLVAAMEWQLEDFQKRSGVAAKLVGMDDEPELGPAAKTSLFRIVQESLTNIARYASAKNVVVSLEQTENQLILSIKDDGVGFDREKTASVRTLGILGMRERTAMMGGNYAIISSPGKGTTVVVTVPLNFTK